MLGVAPLARFELNANGGATQGGRAGPASPAMLGAASIASFELATNAGALPPGTVIPSAQAAAKALLAVNAQTFFGASAGMRAAAVASVQAFVSGSAAARSVASVNLQVLSGPAMLAPVGVARTVAATTVSIAYGPGLLPPGDYYYAVTATTAAGETLPTSAFHITTITTGRVMLTWVQNGAPTTGYNIYRGPTPGFLYYLGAVDAVGTFIDIGGLTAPGHSAPTSDTSGSPQATVVAKLARQITPAHLAINAGYTQGFLVGISLIGIESL